LKRGIAFFYAFLEDFFYTSPESQITNHSFSSKVWIRL